MGGRFTLRNTAIIASKIDLEVEPKLNIVPSDDILTMTPSSGVMLRGAILIGPEHQSI